MSCHYYFIHNIFIFSNAFLAQGSSNARWLIFNGHSDIFDETGPWNGIFFVYNIFLVHYLGTQTNIKFKCIFLFLSQDKRGNS